MNESIEKYDLIVIGAGTGGVGVARPCALAGWKVAIIDELPYGGTCMLRGCDPKKMLIGVTEGVDWNERMKKNGLEITSQKVDWRKMMAFKKTFTEVMPPKLEKGLDKIGIETIHGNARFNDDGTLAISGRKLEAEKYLIATGAKPRPLNIQGEEFISTSTDFLELENKPSRVVFIGGGFIGFEFSHISKRSGAKEVTILQRGKHALVNFDQDLVEMQVERTRKLGIEVQFEVHINQVLKTNNGYNIEYSSPDGNFSIECDLIVHSAGRVPNIDTMNLAAIGVETGKRGIKVNEYLRSISNPNIFSVGDCADTGAPNLTPVSANEARIAAKNILAGNDERVMIYPPIPSVVFTLPPVARVGLDEKQAQEKGLEYEVKFSNTKKWYSSLRVGEEYSGYKVLIEKNTGKILGAHLIGPGAEEQINVFALAMGQGMTANKLKGVIFAYPSYSSDLGSMV
jgi:glutathione reductase (NADPH)